MSTSLIPILSIVFALLNSCGVDVASWKSWCIAGCLVLTYIVGFLDGRWSK